MWKAKKPWHTQQIISILAGAEKKEGDPCDYSICCIGFCDPGEAGFDAIGGLYWKNGYEDEAEFYFNKQIELCNKRIELGRSYSDSYYDLASVYAFRGEKEKAFENLRSFVQKHIIRLWSVTLIKNEFLFDGIRSEPEFQQIVRDVEAKYQAEHERVRQWLEENEML